MSQPDYGGHAPGCVCRTCMDSWEGFIAYIRKIGRDPNISLRITPDMDDERAVLAWIAWNVDYYVRGVARLARPSEDGKPPKFTREQVIDMVKAENMRIRRSLASWFDRCGRTCPTYILE